MSDATASSIKRSGEEPAAVPDAKKNKAGEADVPPQESGADAEDDDDDMAEIDESNIITGSRTRGKKIDFTKVADEGVDEDDEDDEDVIVGDESRDLDDDEEDSPDEDEDEAEAEAETK